MTPVLANILQPLIDVFETVLKFFHDTVGLGWGFSIIALTLTVRALLLPIALKQVKSMRGMQLIAPQMKQIQAKYKDDKQRQQQELMKLYQEHKVNPFASCLPLAAQLPVFISLFYMLRHDLRQDICPDINPIGSSITKPCGHTDASNFLFIPDITDKATGGVLIALVVLYIGTQLASSLLMSVSADQTQRRLFLVLPFLFVPFILSFPAGLLVYWITTNTWTIVQQYIVRRSVGPPPVAVAAAAGAGGSGGGGGLAGLLRRPEPSTSGGGNGSGASGSGSAPRRTSAPPPPPSKRKKKRSGRRR